MELSASKSNNALTIFKVDNWVVEMLGEVLIKDDPISWADIDMDDIWEAIAIFAIGDERWVSETIEVSLWLLLKELAKYLADTLSRRFFWCDL